MLVISSGAARAQDKALWDKIRDNGEIVCGAMPSYPIVSYAVPGPAKYEGYASNFCRAIAEGLSMEMKKYIAIRWQETSWATLVLDLQAGRLDIWPGMSATEERKKALDMSGPLYALAECMLHRKGFEGFKTWTGYNDPKIRIAVTSGTTEEKVVRALAPKAEMLSFKQVSEAILAVQAGRADALTLAVTTCLHTMKTTTNIFGGYSVPEPVSSESSAAGMRKDGDSRLLAWVTKWGEDNRANGRVRWLFMDAMQKADFDLGNLPAGLQF